VSNGILEAVGSLVQVANIAYLVAGKLDFATHTK